MKSRLVTSLLVVGAIFALACVDMSAPKGPLSISEIRLPSPSVIIGDTMRDSNGKAMPVRVIAFDVNNLPIPGEPSEIFVTDSVNTAAAHLTASFLIGDRFGTVHLLGQINGLQTPGVMVPVTYRPDTLRAGRVDSVFEAILGDSTPRPVPVTVTSDKDSASQGIRVEYAITRAPNSRDSANPAVYFGSNGNKQMPSTLDTTGPGGSTDMGLIVVSGLLQDTALINGNRTDTIEVVVTASYAGSPLAGSPVTYKIPVRVVLPGLSVAPLGSRSPSTHGIVAPLHSQRGAAWARAVVRETPRREP